MSRTAVGIGRFENAPYQDRFNRNGNPVSTKKDHTAQQGIPLAVGVIQQKTQSAAVAVLRLLI
ncbi:hypothetical protein [Cyclobacterium xiamenense]|uniref:hypothetical protein n=1 Tax=Cyclobacterium xiamenense TaxID=1297121 RepID=UPI0035CF6E58